MVFPSAEPVNTTDQVTDQAIDQVADQATDQVKALLSVMINEHNRSELMDFLNLSHNHTFRQNYLHPAIEKGLIELTIPDKPNSSKDRKSTRLNSSHVAISYAVFCLKKKK